MSQPTLQLQDVLSLTLMVNPSLKQTVLLLGEIHTHDPVKCDQHPGKSITGTQFLVYLFKALPGVFFDVFFESDQHMLTQKWKPSSGMEEAIDIFRPCILFHLCQQLLNVRMHWIDARPLPLFDYTYNMLILGELNLSEATNAQVDEALNKALSSFTKLQDFDSTLALLRLTNNPQVLTEIKNIDAKFLVDINLFNRLELLDLAHFAQQYSFLSHVGKLVRTASLATNSLSKRKKIRLLQPFLLSVSVIISEASKALMDSFFLAKLWSKFQYPGTPQFVSNAIVYTGDRHIDVYRKVLKSRGYREVLRERSASNEACIHIDLRKLNCCWVKLT